jgi:GT2 family glycosyltransferase
MKRVTVSVIILNWNGKELLRDCLSSLKQQSYREFEVIVVDNGSTDGSADLIRSEYSDFVELVCSKINLGFGRGNNIGVKHSSGKYVLLLNNDCVVDKLWIAELVRVAESERRVGMCGSKILSCHDRHVIDNTGHLIYRDGLNRGRGRLEVDAGQYDMKRDIFFPSACAALYRREAFDEIGGFDEDFFAYGDDTELGIRVRLAGWKCQFVPTAIAYHKYSGSTSAYSPLKAFLVERNRMWVALKCFPIRYLLLGPFFTLGRYILQAYGALCKKGAAGRFTREHSHFGLMWILFKANVSALLGCGIMLRKRRRIKIRVSQQEILSWFRDYGIGVHELALKE